MMRPEFLLTAILAAVLSNGIARGDESAAGGAERTEDVSSSDAAAVAAANEFFERRVRPVLAANCFSCHGEEQQESGLRLDSRDAVLRGGDGGAVVVPGTPAESRLVDAIHYRNGLEMPPTGQLKPDEIDALEKWVALGLPWPRGNAADEAAWKSHWAFQPVRKPAVPSVVNRDWPRMPIDCFILARLEAEGIEPSRPADRRTLIRRVTFDLTGLPPTPDEVEAFINDPSPDAYERVIDRLLASPAYGERWGRHWLDVARYADNKGYVFFEEKKYPWAYTYRDYVVQAFNDDLPYDRFILEQLAADQLEPRDGAGEGSNGTGARANLAAMGFLTLGARFMNDVHDILDDRVDVVTRGLLGLTVTCARCHDHKYDPITQADYYALYGVFRSSEEPTLPPVLGTMPDTDEARAFTKEMEARLGKLEEFVDREYQAIIEGARTRIAEYLLAAYARRDQPSTENFMLLVDKGDINPAMLLRWEVYLREMREVQHPVWTIWHAFAALDEANFASQAAELAARLTTPGAVGTANPLVLAEFSGPAPTTMADVAARYAEHLKRIDAKWRATVVKTLPSGSAVPERLMDPAEEELRLVLYGPDSPANMPRATGWGFLSLLPDRPSQEEFQELLKAVEEWSMTGPGAPPRAMILNDAPEPYEPRIFLRGNPNRLGDHVPRRFLSVLDPEGEPFSHGSGRIELAQRIVDPENPLTARVIVNRVWLAHFGCGLVDTPSDFGLRSSPPSHPELLDWLARQFMEDGWSFKSLHKRILLSAVYQQQCDDTRSVPQADPENRLLWKMNRQRLSFEALRDALLAVSGSLERKLGGPAVEMFTDAYIPRRTLYGFIDRMDMPGLLVTFDFPNPASSSPRRELTTVAPQALYLMNSSFVAEAACRLAQRADVASLSDASERIARLYLLVYSREPTQSEVAAARAYLGESPSDAEWMNFAQALLMANEFSFID